MFYARFDRKCKSINYMLDTGVHSVYNCTSLNNTIPEVKK